MLSFVYCIFGKKRGENIKFIKTVDEWDRLGLAFKHCKSDFTDATAPGIIFYLNCNIFLRKPVTLSLLFCRSFLLVDLRTFYFSECWLPRCLSDAASN